jgi:hypothetical protein
MSVNVTYPHEVEVLEDGWDIDDLSLARPDPLSKDRLQCQAPMIVVA